MANNQPKNLSEAVELQLEKMGIYPIKNVTGEFLNEENYTPERLKLATGIAIENLGADLKASQGIAPQIKEFLERRKQDDYLKGKAV